MFGFSGPVFVLEGWVLQSGISPQLAIRQVERPQVITVSIIGAAGIDPTSETLWPSEARVPNQFALDENLGLDLGRGDNMG